MVNYDVILNLISIVLLLIILFVILFGCKGGRRERFTNKEDDEEEEKPKKEVKKDNKPVLSKFENKVLNELSNGTLTTEAFTDLIKKEKFTQDNLNNVINFVEYSKGVVN